MFSPRYNACWNWVNVFGVAVELYDQWSLPLSSEVVLVSSDPKSQSLEFRQGVAAPAPHLTAEGDSGHVKRQHFLGGEGSFSQLHDCRNLLGSEMMGTVADIESMV